MTKIGFFAFAAAALLLAGQAQALSLTNRDSTELTLSIGEGDEHENVTQVTIGAGETMEGLCQQGCTIAIPEGAMGEFEGSESVEIVNRQFEMTE